MKDLRNREIVKDYIVQFYDKILNSSYSDLEIQEMFKNAQLTPKIREDLKFILEKWDLCPIAVRSSSVVEDSQFQSYAGIFNRQI